MPSSAAATSSFRTVLRRFRRNRGGSAAIEFALVAPVFFALLFAILETALVFFAGQVLETVTQDSARKIMTGQAQMANYSKEQFKENVVCPPLALARVLFNCDNVFIEAKSYPTFPTSRSPNRSTPRRISRPPRAIAPAPAATSSWCGCSINGRCSLPGSVTTSRTSPAASDCFRRPLHFATSLSSPTPPADRTER